MPLDRFIGRILARSGILRSSTRGDLERELRAHFEDAMEAAPDPEQGSGNVMDIVCRRFGDPDEIGRELEEAHRFERRAFLAADALLLMGMSVLAVAAVVLSFQLSIALTVGIPPSHAFPRLRGQSVGFVSLALGYMSLHWEERILKRFRLLPAFILNFCGFAWLFALASTLLGLRSVAAGIPFIAGALVRLLQRSSWHPVWFLGTVLPTVASALIGGPLLATGGDASRWLPLLLRWIGQTLACYFLTLVAQSHARRRFGPDRPEAL